MHAPTDTAAQGEPTQVARERRVVLVSNRLPLTLRTGAGTSQLVPSSGGLAAGLSGPHRRGNGVWVGWLGDQVSTLEPDVRRTVEAALSEQRAVPVDLPPGEARRFYDGFSNGVLWPILHHLVDRVPLHARDWEAYVRANQRFANAAVEHARAGDLIWVHDYHLMLAPAMIRKRLPRARIGFFLHVPFPSSEVFRALPWREQLLEGMLGADLIGFHTFSYLRHFTTSLLRLLGLEPEIDRVEHGARTVRLAVFPMGIDGDSFAQLAASPEVGAEVAAIRDGSKDQKILLAVDRLDYTKGFLRRLLAVERLLEREPSWRGKVRFVQLAVPSREKVTEYGAFRREVEQHVGRINGIYGTLHAPPVHYLYRSVSMRQLVSMYRAADVMLVTPLRDGMNLVCKEFVASRVDGDGVLVLSELAGAASELGEAMLVNPYDVDTTATAMGRALTMPEPERRARMTALHERVRQRSVHAWASGFLRDLEIHAEPPACIELAAESDGLASIASLLASAPRLLLLLDYDGTLVPLRRLPHEAAPDGRTLELLAMLHRMPNTAVHVVSGRPRDTLHDWLGRLPFDLWAEHALWHRAAGAPEWNKTLDVHDDWTARIRPTLDEYAARTPGAVVELKTAGVSWHYRAVEPLLGQLQANELRVHLVQMLAQRPVQILSGDKVLEVRPHGATKRVAARAALERAGGSAVVAAFGDDRTDEDMFIALPPGAVSVHVGERTTKAAYRVKGTEQVHALLRRLIDLRLHH
jgi:trehalose 6-phosphate synthase/phosphatase